MASFWYLVVLFLFLASFASSDHISNDIFESIWFPGRTLLQQQGSCPIDWENQNYTIITSKCKGPQYVAENCCNAFKEFSCPFSEQINDLKTGCATALFSYINIYGKYPPGLFANLCKEGQEGLDCEAYLKNKDAVNSQKNTNNPPNKSGSKATGTLSTTLVLVAVGVLMSLFNLV